MNARIVTLFLLLVVSLVALTGSLYVVRLSAQWCCASAR